MASACGILQHARRWSAGAALKQGKSRPNRLCTKRADAAQTPRFGKILSDLLRGWQIFLAIFGLPLRPSKNSMLSTIALLWKAFKQWMPMRSIHAAGPRSTTNFAQTQAACNLQAGAPQSDAVHGVLKLSELSSADRLLTSSIEYSISTTTMILFVLRSRHPSCCLAPS